MLCWTHIGAALPRACHGELVSKSIHVLGYTMGLGAGQILLSSMEEALCPYNVSLDALQSMDTS